MKLFTRLSVILLFACLLSGSMFAGDEDMKVEHKVGGYGSVVGELPGCRFSIFRVWAPSCSCSLVCYYQL